MRMLKLAAGVFLAAAACVAQEAPASKDALQAEYDGLRAAFDKARAEFDAAYKAAATDEEKKQVFEEKWPKAEDWVPRFRAFADKAPSHPSAARAYAFVLNHAESPKEQDVILEALSKHHAASEGIAEACGQMEYLRSAKAEALLRRVVAGNPHREAQGQASFVLGTMLVGRAEMVRRIEGNAELRGRYEKMLDKEAIDAALEKGSAALQTEAESLLDGVVARYADIKTFDATLGDRAKGQLFEIRNLAVGKTAPEISGSDSADKPMKLSELRGKVVFLDFWGHW